MIEIHDLLQSNPSSKPLTDWIASLSSKPGADVPDIKSYSDIVYFNYYTLGVSLSFVPTDGYKLKTGMKRSELKDERLSLDGIDIYNVPPTTATKDNRRTAEVKFTTFPATPLVLRLSAQAKEGDAQAATRPSEITVSTETTGKEFVQNLGEPDKKGGGAGPSHGSIGIFCAWSRDGIMVEFGGQEAIGPQAWERGKDAIWRVITVFPPELS